MIVAMNSEPMFRIALGWADAPRTTASLSVVDGFVEEDCGVVSGMR